MFFRFARRFDDHGRDARRHHHQAVARAEHLVVEVDADHGVRIQLGGTLLPLLQCDLAGALGKG